MTRSIWATGCDINQNMFLQSTFLLKQFSSFRNTIVKSFRQEFLEPAYSEPIINFILPCLTQNNYKIPLLCMLENNEVCGRNPWLLHSVLVLADRHPGNLYWVRVKIFLKLRVLFHRIETRQSALSLRCHSKSFEWMPPVYAFSWSWRRQRRLGRRRHEN